MDLLKTKADTQQKKQLPKEGRDEEREGVQNMSSLNL